ncbi:MAG: hypothetical protein IEMM0001_1309 [bacterium]|nr:MAG: hypothetical protein IEMM0001_1309 [bacterium]
MKAETPNQPCASTKKLLERRFLCLKNRKTNMLAYIFLKSWPFLVSSQLSYNRVFHLKKEKRGQIYLTMYKS